MKVWQIHESGEPADVLTFGDINDPEPGPGQVVVRAALAAVVLTPDTALPGRA